MWHFIKPLRRKIGVMTLVVACVFTAAWVRSLSHNDEIDIWSGYLQIHSVNSSPTGICCMKWSNLSPAIGMFSKPDRRIAFQSFPGDVCNPFRFSTPEWHWAFGGFHFAQATINPPGPGNLVIWIIPYWSIIIPLTALSAWLLLGKPRQTPTTPKPMSI